MDPKIEELIAASRFLHRISHPMTGFTSDYELYSTRLDNAIRALEKDEELLDKVDGLLKAFEENDDKELMYKIEELLEAAKKVLNPPSRLRKAIRVFEIDKDFSTLNAIASRLDVADSIYLDMKTRQLLGEAIQSWKTERGLT